MRRLLFNLSLGTCVFFSINAGVQAQSVGINSTGAVPASSSMLDIASTTKGLLIPRMTAAQRTAITSPATSLLVYQTDGSVGFYFYNGSSWRRFVPASYIEDLGGDTRVATEDIADQISMNIAGTTRLTLRKHPSGTAAIIEPIDDNSSCFFGQETGQLNEGVYNVGFGPYNMNYNIIRGLNNIAFGYGNLANVLNGNSNLAIGSVSLFNLNDGNYNIAIGQGALYNAQGNSNIAIGKSALSRLISGDGNIAIGEGALESYDGVQINVAIGTSALLSNSSGVLNTAVGSNTQSSGIDGSENTSLGYGTLGLNRSGNGNVAVGAYALESNEGSYNTALGGKSMLSASLGEENTAIGYLSLASATGRGNTALGVQAGETNPGNGNVFIGYQAGQNELGSDKLYIDNSNTGRPLIYGDFSTDELFFWGTTYHQGNAVFSVGAKVDGSYNFGIGIDNSTITGSSVLGITKGSPPTSSIANGILLYAENPSAELKVRDEAGNVTTLSPHNFSLIPQGKSEELAWAFYSEREHKIINVDMAKMARLVEQISGENLVYLKDKQSNALELKNLDTQESLPYLQKKVMEQDETIQKLFMEQEEIIQKLLKRIERLESSK